MTLTTIVALDLLGLGLIALVVQLLRTHKLYVSYAVFWLLLIVGLMVVNSIPSLSTLAVKVTRALFSQAGPGLLAFFLILSVLFVMSINLSVLHARQIELIQRLALSERLGPKKPIEAIPSPIEQDESSGFAAQRTRSSLVGD
jgi:hypothetical protein